MNYMENLLHELRETYGLGEEAVGYVRLQVTESFRTGLKLGRERRDGLDKGSASRRLPRKHA